MIILISNRKSFRLWLAACITLFALGVVGFAVLLSGVIASKILLAVSIPCIAYGGVLAANLLAAFHAGDHKVVDSSEDDVPARKQPNI